MIYVFDYATLKLIWRVFMGVLLVGFAVLDGFDLGVGALLRFIGRSDEERRVMLNAIGPTWEGNQVWFITAGGATFAAWPLMYATAFSGFYVALMLTLFALFFRPVGIEYRGKVKDPRWRNAWDWTVYRGRRAGADFRRGLRQPAAGRAVPFRLRPTRVLHGLVLRPPESVRASRRCRQPRHADDAWCDLRAIAYRRHRAGTGKTRGAGVRHRVPCGVCRGGHLDRHGHRCLPYRDDAASGFGLHAAGEHRGTCVGRLDRQLHAIPVDAVGSGA